jgi:small nuclear ribonucleoprotein (snRNP)-like protein
VQFRNNTKIDGTLIAYDEHMNLMLKDIDLLKINSEKGEQKKLVYLRGDSVKLVGVK